MTQVKGSTLVPRLNYLKAHDPGGAWERLLAEVGPDFAGQIQQGVMTHQWYPLEFYVRLNRAIDSVLGRGDLKLIWQLGRYSAEEALRGIYKVFLKVGSPEFIISAAATIWKQYYDTAKLSIGPEPSPDKRKHYRLSVSGFQSQDEAIWLSIGGWVERTLEMSGARNLKVEMNASRLRPGVNCDYQLSWD